MSEGDWGRRPEEPPAEPADRTELTPAPTEHTELAATELPEHPALRLPDAPSEQPGGDAWPEPAAALPLASDIPADDSLAESSEAGEPPTPHAGGADKTRYGAAILAAAGAALVAGAAWGLFV